MLNEFIPIPNYSNYLINRLGEIYSLKRNQSLKPIKMKLRNGQLKYMVFISGDKEPRRGLYIHNLVALTFLENPNNWCFVGHKDKDGLNNHVDNLYWREKKNENKSPKQRLTKEQAMEIYKLSQGLRFSELKEIADTYGVQSQTVQKIKRKQIWTSLHK